MKGQVFCFGEALIDFLQLPTSEKDVCFKRFAGGAPANVAVAISKLGGNAAFLGQLSKDSLGVFLLEQLSLYGVNMSYVKIHPSAKTALALVSLDDQGERSFDFYRDNTADMVMKVASFGAGMFKENDVLHVCSNTLTTSSMAQVTKHVIGLAKNADALVSFDVNLRHNLWSDGYADAALVNKLVSCADIVKLSLEELDYLKEIDARYYINSVLAQGVRLVLVTDGSNSVQVFSENHSYEIATHPVDVVDSTGAGDAFMGGFLHQLNEQNGSKKDVLKEEDTIRRLIGFANQCGRLAVSRQGAFSAFTTMEELLDNNKR